MNTTNLKKVLKKRILLSSILALTLIMLLLSGYVNNYLWIIPFIAFIIPISKLFEYWLIYKKNNIDDKVRKILKNRVILNFVLVINLALALLGKYSDNYTLYFAYFLLVFIPIGEIQDYWETYKKIDDDKLRKDLKYRLIADFLVILQMIIISFQESKQGLMIVFFFFLQELS